jgi:hypothetical protein
VATPIRGKEGGVYVGVGPLHRRPRPAIKGGQGHPADRPAPDRMVRPILAVVLGLVGAKLVLSY